MAMGVDTFGDQLRHERESRDVALDEIARSTKIRVRYLQALEQGEHERLPGIVFAKGYVRAYAETIGADADRLVAAYVDEQRSLGRLRTEASQENVLDALAAAVEHGPDPAARRMKTVVIGTILLVALGAVFWFGVRPMLNREPVAAVEPPPPATAVAPEPAPVEVEIVETAPVEPVVVEEHQPPPVEPERVEAPVVVAEDPTLSIPDHGVGTGVRQRALVGESSTFETGTQVVFWTRVLGGESGRTLRHVWSHEGTVTGMVELPIGAAHWRTYSRQTLRRGGRWTVEAQDEVGNVLARRTFVATPA